MPPSAPRILPIVGALVVALCACKQQTPPATPTPNTPLSTAAAGAPTQQLKDEVITDPAYVIGISYPPGVSFPAPLAQALLADAAAAKQALAQAVSANAGAKQSAPYDLTLSYTVLADTPILIAISADGSSYTGGAHSEPLVRRFFWLKREQRLLSAGDLFTEQGLVSLSAFTRKALRDALEARMQDSEIPQEQRDGMREGAGRMIDQGTLPVIESFADFEPVLGADGKLAGLRFVFAPYQVGPYSDGTQSVVMPAADLLPAIAPAWRSLFTGG